MVESDTRTGIPIDVDRLRALPKAEIHIHLEGSLDLPTSWQSGDGRLRDLLERLTDLCSQVRTAEDLASAAYSVAAREHASGVGWADVIINPDHWPGFDGDLGGLLAGVHEGFTAAEREGLTPVGVCVSLSRSATAERAEHLVRELRTLAHPRVVGLSIDGDEAATGPTGARFRRAFELARRAGFRTTAHAGESSGPDGVRDAIDMLAVERIDHGIRAIEAPELVARLAAERVPLGVCPTSNVKLGLASSLHTHPVELLRRTGVPVSINTDDPAVLGITLAGEYAACARAFGWGEEELRTLARTSIEASFAPADIRHRLLDELRSW